MSIWKIAYRSIQQRSLASLLTTASMALGVMLLVCVLSIHGVISQQFRNNSSLGYNLIVGAKGGKLQLTLNTVFYLSEPIENIPYDFYLEFVTREQRDKEMSYSLRGDATRTQWELAQLHDLGASAAGLPGPQWLASLAGTAALAELDPREDLGRDGKYGQFTTLAIPLALGDYLGQYRVVGTTPALLNDLRFGDSAERQFEFAKGRNFVHKSPEHGYFEAVLGHHVARARGLKVGDQIAPSHSAPDGHVHELQFTVVGILKPSGTPNDRAVFVNIEGFFLMDGHARPIKRQGMFAGSAPPADRPPDAPPPIEESPPGEYRPLPIEQREVTAILVRTSNPRFALGLPNSINEGEVAQAVLPVAEIYSLFDRIVGPIQKVLFALTLLICIVSGISILVSIYNSMNDRRQEIAVMRALGAARGTILQIILAESILLAVGGGLLGWIGGHTINWLASPLIESQTGVQLGFFDLAPRIDLFEIFQLDVKIEWLRAWLSVSPELLLIPGLILLAVLVGLLPAVSAYRTDVAKSLAH